MGSLWTPDGEHSVPPTPEPESEGEDLSADTLRAAAAAIGVDLDALDDEEKGQLRAELAEMMRVRREVAATPAPEMLANHMMRLFDLATIYLEGDPPSFSDASTVIEAFRAVLEGLGDRLGDSQQPLTEALGQLQMLFVQVKDSKARSTGT